MAGEKHAATWHSLVIYSFLGVYLTLSHILCCATIFHRSNLWCLLEYNAQDQMDCIRVNCSFHTLPVLLMHFGVQR